MTPSLRAAQSAAIDFLLLALRGEEDRAFVVGFDARPQLVQPLTAARDELVDAIAGLHAGGTSALCDAVVFALVQMQRIPGRRALVVLTDGVGREERVDFGTCLRFVQRSGVPIYAILLAGDDPTAAERGGVDAEKLGRLVAAVGGRLFVAENPNRLGGVYRAVGEELRSQYLLTYYPERPAAGGEGWREVAVEVARPGLVARTLAGYYP
jgi:Ca-activated chloride channel family protein